MQNFSVVCLQINKLSTRATRDIFQFLKTSEANRADRAVQPAVPEGPEGGFQQRVKGVHIRLAVSIII